MIEKPLERPPDQRNASAIFTFAVPFFFIMGCTVPFGKLFFTFTVIEAIFILLVGAGFPLSRVSFPCRLKRAFGWSSRIAYSDFTFLNVRITYTKARFNSLSEKNFSLINVVSSSLIYDRFKRRFAAALICWRMLSIPSLAEMVF